MNGRASAAGWRTRVANNAMATIVTTFGRDRQERRVDGVEAERGS